MSCSITLRRPEATRRSHGATSRPCFALAAGIGGPASRRSPKSRPVHLRSRCSICPVTQGCWISSRSRPSSRTLRPPGSLPVSPQQSRSTPAVAANFCLDATGFSQHRAFASSALPVQPSDGEMHQIYQPGTSQPDSGMKARASNLMIGSMTLAVIAVAFAGLLGYRKIHGIAQQAPLRIVFEGSASGLRKGGNVNFDGVQVGEIKSLKLDNPRKVVALTMVDNSAPIRKDTVVGLEFQGLTGVAAISLTGGAAAAPPVPLDVDGIPTLTADLSEIESIRDTLHNVDRILFDNRAMLRDALLSFETYTASLASRGDAIDGIMGKADGVFENFDSAMTKIDSIVPGLAQGSAEELYDKVRTIRELADSFNKRSGAFMEEGRRSLLDISQSAIKVTRKLDPQAVSGDNPPAPRPPRQKRQ